MAKKSGLRLIKAANAEQSKQALRVFLSMQAQPMGVRARLAMMLIQRSDLKYFAKKNGMTVKEFLKGGR
jgi:hypothetical protein